MGDDEASQQQRLESTVLTPGYVVDRSDSTAPWRRSPPLKESTASMRLTEAQWGAARSTPGDAIVASMPICSRPHPPGAAEHADAVQLTREAPARRGSRDVSENIVIAIVAPAVRFTPTTVGMGLAQRGYRRRPYAHTTVVRGVGAARGREQRRTRWYGGRCGRRCTRKYRLL